MRSGREHSAKVRCYWTDGDALPRSGRLFLPACKIVSRHLPKPGDRIFVTTPILELAQRAQVTSVDAQSFTVLFEDTVALTTIAHRANMHRPPLYAVWHGMRDSISGLIENELKDDESLPI